MKHFSKEKIEYITNIALYHINNRSTIRKTAEHFNISKSSIHINLQKHLKYVDRDLYHKYLELSKLNVSLKHIRGGLATQLKYANKKEVLDK